VGFVIQSLIGWLNPSHNIKEKKLGDGITFRVDYIWGVYCGESECASSSAASFSFLLAKVGGRDANVEMGPAYIVVSNTSSSSSHNNQCLFGFVPTTDF
jgi:hypothetical protein